MKARVFSAALALMGCWGGGSGRLTSFDGKAVIGGLADTDFTRLCADVDRWNERQFGSPAFRRSSCEIEAAVALREALSSPAGLPARCRESASACEERKRGQSSIPPRCERPKGACSLTVGELEQCLSDLAYNMYFLLLTAPMCDDVCRNVDPLTLDAASCATVRASCPGFQFTRPSFTGLDMTIGCL